MQRAVERVQRVSGNSGYAMTAPAPRPDRLDPALRRRTSILGPVLLVSAGVVLLLVESGRLPPATFSALYARWWPLLLVGAGVVLLLEWAYDRQTLGQNVPGAAPAQGWVYTPRRQAGGGIVLLIVLLATGGTAMEAITGHTYGLSIAPERFAGFFGEKHESESDLDLAFPAGTHLSIESPKGDVTVVGHSADGRMHVTINKSFYAWSDEDSDKKAAGLKPNVVESPGALLLQMPYVEGASADLTVTLPETGATSVTANNGAVNISGMHAPVNVTALRGTVDLNGITGAVVARTNSNSSSFSAHAITGDVALKGHADDLNVSDVTGQVSLEGDFYGDTHLEHLAGPVSFDTSRTHFKTAKVDGEVDISPKESMTADHLAGPTTLKTRSRNIDFTDLSGDVMVENSNGSVELASTMPLGNVTVENRNGGVTLNLPSRTGFVLQAETRDGKIENNLDLMPATADSVTRLNSKVGDGKAQIHLRTTHADVEIHAGPQEDGDDKKP
jgi:DUF4097 and DUF4098 domain-containing protein YvlB